MGEWCALDERLERVTEEPARCEVCGGDGLLDPPNDGRNHNPPRCPCCGGVGFFEVDPFGPAPARPGSQLKIAFLVARYAAGIALWDERDGLLE